MKNKRTQIIWRYGLVSMFISVLAILIVYNALSTTVIHADQWNAKADSLLSRIYFVQPKRGEILADNGTVLATNLTLYNIYIDYRTMARRDTAFVVRLDSICDSLACYYPVRDKEAWRDYLARPMHKDIAKSKRKTNHLILKNATYADYMRIRNFPFFRDYKKKYSHGLYYTSHEARVMPYGSMASRGIGRCNYVQVPKFSGARLRRDSTDALHGYSGLEYALDSLLYGRAGTAKTVQLTQRVGAWVDEPAVDGYTVKTTINVNLQDIVENELQAMLQLTQADWATCLLMEVATGDIKAISNLDRDSTGSVVDAMNYAVEAYEPGSVMKPISMIVALEDGFAFPLEKQYAIGRSYPYAGGSPIHDTHSPATLPISRFIEYSSNIGMTKLIAPHFENNLNGFRQRLRDLGFFDRFNTGMHKERPPYFPTLHAKSGGRVSLSRMAYGYSTMIPPLYTCAVYNAIANNGKFVRPRIVMERIAPDGTVTENKVSYVRDSICSQRNARILREMLYSVVYGEGGTAKSLRNDTVHIAGKTGTCRIAYESKRDTSRTKGDKPVVGGYRPNAYRLAFCGFFPYENPKYTCMVLISNPSLAYRGAATTSGRVVKNIAMKMYSRGLLGNHSDYMDDPNPGTLPTVYANDVARVANARNVVGSEKSKHFKLPQTAPAGHVPDVTGLSIRDALSRIEQAGYRAEVHGSGYAFSQTPAPKTALAQGKKVIVKFTTK